MRWRHTYRDVRRLGVALAAHRSRRGTDRTVARLCSSDFRRNVTKTAPRGGFFLVAPARARSRACQWRCNGARGPSLRICEARRLASIAMSGCLAFGSGGASGADCKSRRRRALSARETKTTSEVWVQETPPSPRSDPAGAPSAPERRPGAPPGGAFRPRSFPSPPPLLSPPQSAPDRKCSRASLSRDLRPIVRIGLREPSILDGESAVERRLLWRQLRARARVARLVGCTRSCACRAHPYAPRGFRPPTRPRPPPRSKNATRTAPRHRHFLGSAAQCHDFAARCGCAQGASRVRARGRRAVPPFVRGASDAGRVASPAAIRRTCALSRP